MTDAEAGSEIVLRVVDHLWPAEVAGLADLLIAVVADGASVGFLPPLAREEATAYWEGALGPGVVLLVAERAGRIVGTVQLQSAMRPNGLHRAEIAKLMVHPDARRQGLGRRLMEGIEAEARRVDRTLLVLDTREGDPSNALYGALGYVEVGRIPRYALAATGELAGTVIHYKEL
jgi:ribosomal protein S18 acetylase RimI-like enzyme